MIQLKSNHKHFKKSSNNSWSIIIHNMIGISNFSSFGSKEVGQWKSESQSKFKQTHTKHQNMHQLQLIIKQKQNMINEWDQSHDKLQDVYITHARFQVHTIMHEDFTNHITSCVTKSQQMTKQGRKFQSNRKCHQ